MDSDMAETSVWCFQCGSEYAEEVAECLECGVPTTSERPAEAVAVGEDTEDQMAYELHEWSGQGRHVLDRLLTAESVSHAWQGATLIVRELDEEKVDDLVRQAEIATMPTLSADEPTMVYELDEYSDELRTRVADLIGAAGIAHEFDARGDLVVHEVDEEGVDELFEKLDAADTETFTFGPGVDGVDPTKVISNLFLTSGKLRKSPGDAKAVVQFVENVDLAEQLQLPFGFKSPDWKEILDETGLLRDVLSGENESDDHDVADLAEGIYDTLRPLV